MRDKYKAATYARHYGASELMLATMTGRYPPPHKEMDSIMAQIEQAKLDSEAAQARRTSISSDPFDSILRNDPRW